MRLRDLIEEQDYIVRLVWPERKPIAMGGKPSIRGLPRATCTTTMTFSHKEGGYGVFLKDVQTWDRNMLDDDKKVIVKTKIYKITGRNVLRPTATETA